MGSGLGVLDTIDAEVVIRSQEEIKKALQRPEASHPTNLLGLAILAILATRPPSKSRATGSSHLTDRNETYTGNISIGSCQSDTNRLARQFFATAKAQKTIDIAVVMAIQSCSRSCAINRLEALEMLRLSKEIIQACNPSEKQKWMNKNPGHAKRLYERATRHDLEPNARLEVCVVVLIHDRKWLKKDEDLGYHGYLT